MTAQDSLFDAPAMTQSQVDRGVRGRARRSDPDTSQQAAEHIGKGAEAAIKRLYRIPRSLTDDQIAGYLPEWYAPTVKTARSRLTADGFLVDSGERRDSARGRPQIVWRRARDDSA
jgi:hypothetical protein